MEELDTQLVKQAYLSRRSLSTWKKKARLTVDDRTVYVNRQIWASLNKANPEALEILRKNGLKISSRKEQSTHFSVCT